MMSRFPLLALFVTFTAQAGWKTHVVPGDSNGMPARATIQYAADAEFGLPAFQDAITQLTDGGYLDRLQMIVLHGQSVEPHFQQEVIEALEEYAPDEFAEAKDSAGNMHNPKVIQLKKVFDEIVLRTPTVDRLDAELRSVGRRISGASHEKLGLSKDDGGLTIFFFLYRDVEAI